MGGNNALENILAPLNRLGITASQGNDGLALDPDAVIVGVYEQDTGNIVSASFTLVVTCPKHPDISAATLGRQRRGHHRRGVLPLLASRPTVHRPTGRTLTPC